MEMYIKASREEGSEKKKVPKYGMLDNVIGAGVLGWPFDVLFNPIQL